ncbi:MAG: shikimate dehydrogenase [Desulfarculaceae bacterium]|nr:shikimate dehydrogenase [Desulfarculaceae bacterium]MCF8114934.1 shikimate dehydrogenase [Desulfarculaceae bacterium]
MRLGVMGDQRVEHSLSPRMHNAVLAELGLAGSYEALPVEPDAVGAFVRSLAEQGFHGVNVTVPHKQAVMPFLDEVSGEAALLGAVNTIAVEEGRLLGSNTDCPGFASALADTGFAAPGRPALVVGAGGAARAVVRALAKLEAAPLWVAARRPEQAGELCAALGGEPLDMDQAAEATREAALLINTASASSPVESPELAAWAAGLQANGLQQVMDINYGREDNFWASLARKQGAGFCEGLPMLAAQAALSFARWTGRSVPAARFLAALEDPA